MISKEETKKWQKFREIYLWNIYLPIYLSSIYQLSAICIYLGIEMQSGRVK